MAEAGGVPSHLIEIADNFTLDPGQRESKPSTSSEVLAVGRLSSEKGIDRLIQAWTASKTELGLTVIGDGPERNRLISIASDRVRLLGALDRREVSKRMKEARALMFPSLAYESQPLVLLEAMAAGLAPLAADHPPLRWLLNDLDPASMVSGDAEAWVDAVRLVEDDDFVDRSSIRARNAFEQRFSPESALRSLTTSYVEAIRNHGSSHS
jgi:glycosyltransferase involved in cell wall biosynthesis